jgi:DNA modification methylase
MPLENCRFTLQNRKHPMTPHLPESLERLPLDRLILYANNSRTHSEEQVAQIAASIREFGFTNPSLIDEADGIIAGHGRVLAARKLSMKEVPCIRLGHLTEAQRRAYVIADNKLALNAGWDDALLRVELEGLQSLNFDTGLIGFSEDEIAALLAVSTVDPQTDPDEVPEAPVDPVSVLGDVWLMGKHRIACGDCTDMGTVQKALNGVEPHLMVTDPPYGVVYDPSWRNKAERANGKPLGAHAEGKVLNDDKADWRDAWALFPGDVAYVWHASLHAHEVAISLEACDFKLRSMIVWSKSNFAISQGHYHWQHEPCWYAVRKGGTGHWNGDRKQTTLWQIPKPQKSETGHGTQKPVECMKRPIENNSSLGQAVYEPFSGSGTTIIACEMTGRCAHAIELNPQYVDVAVERWQNLTGKEAVHAESGKTFNAMKARKPKAA